MIYVYTCILGGFDNLRPPLVPSEPGTRFICFTDIPVLPDVPPWEFRPVHRVFDEIPHDDGIGHCLEVNAARTSRLPKILPHLMLPADTDYSIWIDGNFQLARPASQIVNEELRFDDWAAHMHPCRGCVYEEGEVLIHEATTKPHEWPRLDPRAVQSEIQTYRDMGYPAALAILTANALIVRRHSPEVAKVNETWWKLFSRGCGRDQLSFPVAARIHNLNLNRMKHYHDIYNSPLIKFGWHAAWKDKPDNVAYRLERERIAARVEKLLEVVGDGGYHWKVY